MFWRRPQARTDALNAALRLLRAAGDREGVCRVLCDLAEAAAGDGDWTRAEAHAREARELASGLHLYELGCALKSSAISAGSLPVATGFADPAVAVLQPLGAFLDIAYLRYRRSARL